MMPLMALKVTLNAQITCFLLGEANAMYNESCLSVGDTIYWALTSMTYGGAVESPNHTRSWGAVDHTTPGDRRVHFGKEVAVSLDVCVNYYLISFLYTFWLPIARLISLTPLNPNTSGSTLQQ